jgi:hypothetical protein
MDFIRRICHTLHFQQKQEEQSLLTHKEEGEEMMVPLESPLIIRDWQIDVTKYVSFVEAQNFSNGYRIRFHPTEGIIPENYIIHYTVWWSGKKSTSLNPTRVRLTDFVEIGKWFGKESESLPLGEVSIEVTIYTALGEELGTGETYTIVTSRR